MEPIKVEERIDISCLTRIKSKTIIDSITNCWLFKGAQYKGYGRIQPIKGIRKYARVHRLSAHIFLGLDLNNKKLQVNHKCLHTSCWNPEHLYIGTQQENIDDNRILKRGQFSKTHCPKGHPYEGDNIYIGSKGERRCRICIRNNYR